jgi:apolipoprotein D and lipocalin family protein
MLLVFPVALLFTGCASFQNFGELPTPTEPVNLTRIDGVWHVQAYLPTIVDRNAYNSTFEFDLHRTGDLFLGYTFNSGGPEGALKSYHFDVEIDDYRTNADWSLQLIWPFERDFRVIYVDPDYEVLVFGHPNRKYLYVLSRDFFITPELYEWIMDYVASLGYDTSFAIRPGQQ